MSVEPFAYDLTKAPLVADMRVPQRVAVGLALGFAFFAYALVTWDFVMHGINPGTVAFAIIGGFFGTLSLYLGLWGRTGLAKPLRLTVDSERLSISLAGGTTRVYEWGNPHMRFSVIEVPGPVGELEVGGEIRTPRRAPVGITQQMSGRIIDAAERLGAEVTPKRKRIRYVGVTTVYNVRGKRPQPGSYRPDAPSRRAG